MSFHEPWTCCIIAVLQNINSYHLVCVCARSVVPTLHKACQGSLFIEFSRQEYWHGLLFPTPGELLTQGLNLGLLPLLHSVQFSCSVMSDSLRPLDCSTPCLFVHYQLPEFTQTHVLWVGDAIQPSHPLSSPSPPALNLSQHQGLFKWVSSLYPVAKVLETQLQHQSFQWTLRTAFL